MSHYKTIAALGKPIVIHTNITRFLGSMTASALLSYIMYWSERTDRRLGFYRSLDEMMAETALSQHELRSARKRLTELGLISETYKRLEHRLYFRFNADVFDRWFEACLSEQAQDFAKNADDGFADLIDEQDGQMRNPQMPPVKSTDATCEIRNSLYTNITTNITTNKNIHARENFFAADDNTPPKAAKKSKTATCPVFAFSDWQVRHCQAYALDIEMEFAKFKNHHEAAGNAWKDWSKAFSNWLIKAAQFTQNQQQTQGNYHERRTTAQQTDSVDAYRAKLVAEFNAYYGTAGQSSNGSDFARNVYDMEKTFQEQDAAGRLGLGYSPALGGHSD